MEIYILDSKMNILGVVSTYDAILWNTRFHEPGTFKADFLFTENKNKILQRGNLLYKTDEDEAAVITRKFLKLNKHGEEIIQVQGYMTSRYLQQRIIWEKMVLKGTYEEAMRKMVEEQVISPKDPDRKIPNIRLGEKKGYDGEIEKQISYDNLQTALTDLSKVSALGYRLRPDLKNKIFLFEVYRGEDRTVGTQHPCIFTRDYGNVYTQEYSEDDTNYKNICLIGGSGEDQDRILAVSGQAAGLERYEMFYNASGFSKSEITTEEYLLQIRQKGEEQLAKYYTAKAFESKINQNRAMPFSIGDYVTCTDSKWHIRVDTQVKEIAKGYTKEEKSYVVTFGDSVPTLIDLIKAKE